METLRNKILRAAALSAAAVIASASLAGCGKKIEPEPEVTTPPVTKVTEATTVPTTVTEVTTTEPPPVEPDPLEKYLEYYEENNDFVGWIRIDGITHSNGDPWIDYPVVQGDDNSYYIDHSFENKKSSSGAIYADYKIPITGLDMADNVTLYGHSMKNGTFFRHLLDYETTSTKTINKAYIINFDTRWEEAQYVIVSCFQIGIYDWQDDLPLFEYFKCRNFDTEDDYNYFYENIMLRSFFTSDVECEFGDQFLTLSTCEYNIGDDSRFVVVARKVREGEDPSVYAGTYEFNEHRHRPSHYYSNK